MLPTHTQNEYLTTVEKGYNLFNPVRKWLDKIEVNDPKFAQFLCRIIPAQCPFEQDIVLFGYKIAHIPAMCKLNPFYEQLVGLRFRALCCLINWGKIE